MPPHNRATSIVFALAALGLAAMAVALFVAVGARIDYVVADPGAHELFLVFLLPALVAAICAALLWRSPRAAPRLRLWLVILCGAVIALLVACGWVLVAIMFAAPSVLLLLPQEGAKT